MIALAGCEDDQSSQLSLKDVTARVDYFEYTEDTGNNTSRLRYSITFTNPNDSDVTGFYRITTNADGLESSKLSSDSSPCYSIAANSTCTYLFDEEDSHDLGKISTIKLVSVEYKIENN